MTLQFHSPSNQNKYNTYPQNALYAKPIKPKKQKKEFSREGAETFLSSELDMAMGEAVAAQLLMQLSDEDNNSSEKSSTIKKSLDDDYAQSKKEISWAKKIEVIFGKEEEIHRPKKRRYRTLVSLYMATKPMMLDMHRKKMRY